MAHGRLSPFDALLSGKLRIGGDTALAKRVAQHLSDPSVPFVGLC
jgi:putative sterol carrier protein